MTFSRSREKTERDSFANTKNRPCHSPTAEKNRGGGGCRKRRRALKKSPRALKSNTAGFEKKPAGFVMKLRRLWKQGLGRSSPKAYPSSDVHVWFHRKLTRYPTLRVWFHRKLTRDRKSVV